MRRIDQGLIVLSVMLFGLGTVSLALDQEIGEAALFGALMMSMAVCTRAVRTEVKVVRTDVGRHDGRTEHVERQILKAGHQEIRLLRRAFGTDEPSGPHPLPWIGPFN